jgi:hypothetical protein
MFHPAPDKPGEQVDETKPKHIQPKDEIEDKCQKMFHAFDCEFGSFAKL